MTLGNIGDTQALISQLRRKMYVYNGMKYYVYSLTCNEIDDLILHNELSSNIIKELRLIQKCTSRFKKGYKYYYTEGYKNFQWFKTWKSATNYFYKKKIKVLENKIRDLQFKNDILEEMITNKTNSTKD